MFSFAIQVITSSSDLQLSFQIFYFTMTNKAAQDKMALLALPFSDLI